MELSILYPNKVGALRQSCRTLCYGLPLPRAEPLAIAPELQVGTSFLSDTPALRAGTFCGGVAPDFSALPLLAFNLHPMLRLGQGQSRPKLSGICQDAIPKEEFPSYQQGHKGRGICSSLPHLSGIELW